MEDTPNERAPVPWRSPKPLSAVEQRFCSELWALSCEVALAAFASAWKSRKHRPFSGPKAANDFAERVSLDDIRSICACVLNAAEVPEDRELTLRTAVRGLNAILPKYSRPTGRPKKRAQRVGGLILGSMDTSQIAAREKERLRTLRGHLLPFANGTKAGAFAKQEGFRTLDEVKKYLKRYGLSIDDPEVDRAYSDSKSVQAFIEEYRLDPQLKTALQKQLSRAKKSR